MMGSKRDSIESVTLAPVHVAGTMGAVAERPNLGTVSFRDELAESAQAFINGPAVALAPPVPAPVKAPKKKATVEVEEEEPDLHVTTVKCRRADYLALYDIAIDRVRGKKRGTPNVGAVIREALEEYLEKNRRG
jgi:hypothetical protein